MKNPFTALFRARDKPGRRSPQDAVSAATVFSFGMAGSGKNVNARTAIQVSAVYACVRVIAETVASLPFSVFEQDKAGSHKALDHPLYRILHDGHNGIQPVLRLFGLLFNSRQFFLLLCLRLWRGCFCCPLTFSHDVRR